GVRLRLLGAGRRLVHRAAPVRLAPRPRRAARDLRRHRERARPLRVHGRPGPDPRRPAPRLLTSGAPVKRSVPVSLLALGIDPAAPARRCRELAEGIREAILSGRLRPGARLPSTRALAKETRSARNTVIAAFEQLVAEGYLEGRVGAGTRVAPTLPESLLHARPVPGCRRAAGRRPALAERGRRLLETWGRRRPAEGPPRPFRTGSPAFDAFPTEVWARLMTRRWARVSRQLLAYGDPAGYRPLREAIAAYLREARAVRCDAGQVVVLTSSQQGIEVATRVLLEPGEPVWVEDPGYSGAHDGLTGAGLRLVPVPVDAEGID